MKMDLMVTLWPSFPHFTKFAQDTRLSGIRLNSAMMSVSELDEELSIVRNTPSVPLWFDVKGRQLRIEEVINKPTHLEFISNHPIVVKTPTPVLFKAGADVALLKEVKMGRVLVFEGGPQYIVRPGESFHIRDKSFKMLGPIFTTHEQEKIAKVRNAGIKKWFLSYVETLQEVQAFQDMIGKDDEVMLKIESIKGLEFVSNQFIKKPNLTLVAARGDLYVEVDRPHQILDALRLIIDKDPEAQVGSRLLLSVVQDPTPSCADFLDLAWLADVGYRKFMMCDEMCLKDELLTVCVNVMDAFRKTYEPTRRKVTWATTIKSYFTSK